jgi:uncharacterized protein (DUF2141 family)
MTHPFKFTAITFLLAVAACLPLLAGESATTPLRVELTGLANADGHLYIAVYDSGETWLGEETVLERQVVIADAREGELVTTELDLPPGEYALSIFYDSNDNGELDTNFIGIPKEPIALSNNARARFGPPKYKDAVFTLGTEPVVQRINMEEI